MTKGKSMRGEETEMRGQTQIQKSQQRLARYRKAHEKSVGFVLLVFMAVEVHLFYCCNCHCCCHHYYFADSGTQLLKPSNTKQRLTDLLESAGI